MLIRRIVGLLMAVLATFATLSCAAFGQDRLKGMPGFEQHQRMRREIPGAVKLGTMSVRWKDGGEAFEYRKDGKMFRYDIATRRATEIDPATADSPRPEGRGPGGRRGGSGGPARGRQFDSAISPDGKHKASYRNRNLWLSDPDGSAEFPITSDGDEQTRIKYGIASWVYGEELDQVTAMWWSPDSKRIAFYRFDESRVPDYYLQLNQTRLQSTMDIEAYPKAGAPNPIADLLVYDLDSKNTIRVDARDGKEFDDAVVGHYVYHVAWSPDGTELLFHRTNRRQNIMEFAACDPVTGKCRTIVHEEWLPSWVENSPAMRFLNDSQRFIWTSERTGWKNFYLYDRSGQLLATLTKHAFEVANIVRVDEDAGTLFYMARSGDNPMKLQLHRVGLDGTGDIRITNPAFHHTVDVAPDGKHLIDVAQTHDSPPTTQLLDGDGSVIEVLMESDMTKFEELGLRRAELITFKAADGETDLYGLLHRPCNFDPAKKYPLLISVYAGPATNGARETFSSPNPLTEYGFLVASFDSRSAAGRGKRFLDSIYLKLGTVEVDDQAAAVKSLWNRPELDKNRVGIFGTSYGGTVSALCLLRHPDAFQAACSSSPVTDFRNYDTIYTERYMWLPAENKTGYDAGSAMAYAPKLKGRLMLYYGTADNNVHPSNMMQLVQALTRAGKSFDLQVGPDQGHSSIPQDRMMEFFIENLMLAPATTLSTASGAE